MLDTPAECLIAETDRWLSEFEDAVRGGDWAQVEALFHPDSHWRDLLALTWDIRTVSGANRIVRALEAHVGAAGPSGFRTDCGRTPPRRVTRAGREAVEAIVSFETAAGRGEGVLRLIPIGRTAARSKPGRF